MATKLEATRTRKAPAKPRSRKPQPLSSSRPREEALARPLSPSQEREGALAAAQPLAAQPLADPLDQPPEGLDPSPMMPEEDLAEAVAEANAEAGRVAAAAMLPAFDAPTVSPKEPEVSYKLAFQFANTWVTSSDGGKTNVDSGRSAVGGLITDLVMECSEDEEADRTNWRLRLAFIEPDGRLAELNLHALTEPQRGEPYVTSPVRSLLGGLEYASESDEDCHALAEGCRFSLLQGTGKAGARGVFVEVAAATDGKWVRMSDPRATSAIPREPIAFCKRLMAVKAAWRRHGLLTSERAITGAMPDAIAQLAVG